ncbi:MAG: mechanosensitive ion channel [Flavobacteriales bacterium]|nr:mechanosensitive ion channel [Flavobacteriales bacterium]
METITGTLQSLYNTVVNGIGDWGLKLLGAIAALIIGLWIIRFIMKGIAKAFDLRQIDATLKPFLITIIGFGLKTLLFITIAGIVGIPTASFAALIAGVGVAIGAAFNGSLGHLASGVMLLVFRPFKVGDLIESNGTLGFVKEISVFVTVLETFQNKTEIIPNGAITAAKITNYSTIGNLRVDMPFAIRYGSDIEKAKSIVMEVLSNDDQVLQNPSPRVAVNNLGQSAVELVALPYSSVEGYWDVYWDTRQRIVQALANAGYEAPYQQTVVTLTNPQ